LQSMISESTSKLAFASGVLGASGRWAPPAVRGRAAAETQIAPDRPIRPFEPEAKDDWVKSYNMVWYRAAQRLGSLQASIVVCAGEGDDGDHLTGWVCEYAHSYVCSLAKVTITPDVDNTCATLVFADPPVRERSHDLIKRYYQELQDDPADRIFTMVGLADASAVGPGMSPMPMRLQLKVGVIEDVAPEDVDPDADPAGADEAGDAADAVDLAKSWGAISDAAFTALVGASFQKLFPEAEDVGGGDRVGPAAELQRLHGLGVAKALADAAPAGGADAGG
ncbi:unnamed protein product, partial [Prorocentrum cordatum]